MKLHTNVQNEVRGGRGGGEPLLDNVQNKDAFFMACLSQVCITVLPLRKKNINICLKFVYN